MSDDTTIIQFRQPGSIADPLTEIARDGARCMLMAVLKAEADGFVSMFSDDVLADGRQRIVRHGAGPERVCPSSEFFGEREAFCKRRLCPTGFQLDGLKFQGSRSSMRIWGWPFAIASRVALR